MDRKIQDFLHLYLGCDCQIAVIVPGQELTWEPDKLNIRWLHGCLNNLVEVKPILRQLSDMTQEESFEEAKEFAKGNLVTVSDASEGCIICDAFRYRYLLSRGFDLFGLIESGLAIDKTTLSL